MVTNEKIDELEYARLLNEKMREHDQYSNDMRIDFTPGSTEKPSGLKAHGGLNSRTILSWAKEQLEKEYEVIVKS
jgi:hypothetical protein